MKEFGMTFTTCDVEETAHALGIALSNSDTTAVLEVLARTPSETINLDILESAILIVAGEL